MKGFVRLEKKYGIKILDDEIYNPLTGKTLKRYKMYSADGCPWQNGLTKEGIKKECEIYADRLIKIKNQVAGVKNEKNIYH